MKNKKELLRTIKFALFSASAGLIQALSFTLLNEVFELPFLACNLTALVLSVLWNFTLNRRYTFQSASNVPKAMLLVALFYAVFTPVSAAVGNYLATTLLWNEYIVEGLAMISNFVLEYLYDRFVVFRNSMDTNDVAQKIK